MSIKYPGHRTEVLQSTRYDPVRAFVRRRRMSGWSISKIYWLGCDPDGFSEYLKLWERIACDSWPSMTLEEYQKVCDIIFGE